MVKVFLNDLLVLNENLGCIKNQKDIIVKKLLHYSKKLIINVCKLNLLV